MIRKEVIEEFEYKKFSIQIYRVAGSCLNFCVAITKKKKNGDIFAWGAWRNSHKAVKSLALNRCNDFSKIYKEFF